MKCKGTLVIKVKEYLLIGYSNVNIPIRRYCFKLNDIKNSFGVFVFQKSILLKTNKISKIRLYCWNHLS